MKKRVWKNLTFHFLTFQRPMIQGGTSDDFPFAFSLNLEEVRTSYVSS